MKQIVVLSGKGGTGKTTIAASFAVLASERHRIVVADCDVEASNMHILLKPVRLNERNVFKGSKVAVLDAEKCVNCGACEEVCRFGAISRRGSRSGSRRGMSMGGGGGEVGVRRSEPEESEVCEYEIQEIFCEGCGVCVFVCPVDALSVAEKDSGEIYVSDVRCGGGGAKTVKMVHASLKAGEEASGKLVSAVRRRASEIALAEKSEIVLIDGPPGVGCPVIASLTGVDLAVLVAEPTKSGVHDLKRVLAVARHFGVNAVVCVNKSDLNAELTAEIERFCAEEGVKMLGCIPYDEAVLEAVSACEPVVSFRSESEASVAIKAVWGKIEHILQTGA
ncbi:MAG: ATP-binding protein [Candidatus Methanospirare jalkutatii]|nr:MAG: ATP-binding protein [Candidatus Methanospirare jalkutatii]UYZ40154.1 MAG: ATP-binding protein [Candidatus Methanospirare jalkutatii]